MPSRNKHGAGQQPVAQQRDERGRGVTTEEQQLGNTSARDRRRDPKLPHERDETAPDTDSAAAASQPGNEVMRRAHDDVVSGKQDTSRSQETDRAYHQLRKPK